MNCEMSVGDIFSRSSGVVVTGMLFMLSSIISLAFCIAAIGARIVSDALPGMVRASAGQLEMNYPCHQLRMFLYQNRVEQTSAWRSTRRMGQAAPGWA